MSDKHPAKRRKHKTQAPPLSIREIRFCQHYADTGKGYQSYIDAGFPEKVTRDATDQAVTRLVRKRQIREYIRELQEDAAAVAKISISRIARGLDAAAHADRTSIFDADGNMLPVGEWPKAVRSIITGFDVDEEIDNGVTTRRIKVRFERSIEARRILAQWKRMIGDAAESEREKGHKPLVVGGEADVDGL